MLQVSSPQVTVEVLGRVDRSILTDDALLFVGFLCAKFEATRQALLENRKTRAKDFDAGGEPSFLDSIDSSWMCAPIPPDIQDRRVEITGPVDRKMVINGLNSGASTYMADFEDSTSPTWNNLIEGQVNLRDAVAGTISYIHPTTRKVYKPNATTAILLVRPRGWHLQEAHLIVNGKMASASLVDFGLYFFHNVFNLVAKGSGPYYYLPKLECHQEAKLWNDVFVAAQQYLGVPVGTIRATVLLETITAAFEMEEILYQLRDHSLGLNCGRWDYLFSFIKKFKMHADKIAPDRSFLTMSTPLMEAYVARLIQTCHRRGTFAMGGMSAAIPVKNDASKNEASMRSVQQDKLREVMAGHDGTWVAHPDLVKVARDVFDQHMPTPNQISKTTNTRFVSKDQLLQLPQVDPSKAITSTALHNGIAVVLAYTEAWLRGVGCIPLNNAMEDAATAEISRAQIWQWREHCVKTADNGVLISTQRICDLVEQEVARHAAVGGKWRLAGKLVSEMLTADELDDFLTTVCYPYIVTIGNDDTPSKL
jgi:malate synthase